MICREKIYVCTCSMFSDNISTLPETILPLFREPAYRVSIIVPPAEPVKERAETYTARLNFEVAKYDLLYNYKNNAQVLNEVGAIISEIKNDPDLTITQFRIAGYASPEGNFNSNMKLSENRARAFAAYLKSHFHIAEDQLSIEWFGEDWQGLYEVVKASYLPEKENIMRLIDNGYDNAELKRKLQTLSGGTIYRTLLHDYYPSLRRNEYTISYIARSFDLEEARELIKTKPHYLSLNEMFLVANSYSPDSKEFREVFDIALKVFPESPVAILNVAAIHIESSEYKQAIEKLQQLETPEAYNNLGVIYAKQQMYEQAKGYFRKADEAGEANAGYNLRQYTEWEKIYR
ncbi:MAG: OmpA family protein [Bacteroides sp.]|nr:OmpA family protein [Bacteroides sp.]